MSDKWMEMKQPMLLMRSRNINITSWGGLVVPCKISNAQGNLARERARKTSRCCPSPLDAKNRIPTSGDASQQRSKASSREKGTEESLGVHPLLGEVPGIPVHAPKKGLSVFKEMDWNNLPHCYFLFSKCITYWDGSPLYSFNNPEKYQAFQITNMLEWIVSNATHFC